MDPPSTPSAGSASRSDSQASRPGSGTDRKRRLTSPESPHRRGSEPGSSSSITIPQNTPIPSVPLGPQNQTQATGSSSSRSNVIDLTGDDEDIPAESGTQSHARLPLSIQATSEPTPGRSGPARTFDEILIPPWQPDNEATHCAVCSTPFTFFFRRHHCRKCGKVVCDNCSPHRITLPRQYIVRNPADEELPAVSTLWGGERVRVCNPCVPDPNFEPPRPLSSDLPQPSPSTASPNSMAYPQHPFGTPAAMLDYLQHSGYAQPLGPNPNSMGRIANSQYQQDSASLGQPLPPSDPRGPGSYHPFLTQRRPTHPLQGPAGSTRNVGLQSHGIFHPPRGSSSGAISPYSQGGTPYRPPHPGNPVPETCPNCTRPIPLDCPASIHNFHYMGACTRIPASSIPHSPEHLRAQSSMRAQPVDPHGLRYTSMDNAMRAELIRRGMATPMEASSSSSSSLPNVLPPTSARPPFSVYGPPTPRPGPRTPLYYDPETGLFSPSMPGTSSSMSPMATQQQQQAQQPPRLTPVPPMATYPATEKDCTNADCEAMECVICLEEFEVGDELAMLECFCKFHKACIVEWYEKGSGRCPTHKIIEREAGGDGIGRESAE